MTQNQLDDETLQTFGREVIALEAAALANLRDQLGQDFSSACKLILDTNGRVVIVGMGKSGHIAGKIAATLASTGTPAFFVHPGEASHGDLGMITPGDLVIGISNSGETAEILTILPIIKRMGVSFVVMTGQPNSTLAKQADICLNTGVEKEACPLNLSPTSSTTTTLAMGDALAVTLLRSRGFTESDFARSHPGGTLGRRLLLYVSDIMHTGDEIPVVQEDQLLSQALLEMSSKGLGMTGVVNPKNELVGIFTDGDLRRTLNRSTDFYRSPIREVMTVNPITVGADILAAEVVSMMRNQSINGLFVIDSTNHILGALNTHDLLRARVL